MDYDYSKEFPAHGQWNNTNDEKAARGQWDNTNDEKAARGGLRHKTLKGSIDKTAPPVGNSAAQYGEAPSEWQNAPIAPPTADVILLVENNFKEIREDIEEFTRLALNCEAFSDEKNHLQGLLSHICKSNIPIELRQEALRGILRTSCWPDILRSVPGYKEVIGEFVEMRSVSA